MSTSIFSASYPYLKQIMLRTSLQIKEFRYLLFLFPASSHTRMNEGAEMVLKKEDNWTAVLNSSV